MNILLLTATYYPSVNGVAVSVKSLYDCLKKKGHTVKVLAPSNPDAPTHEKDVLRFPALSNKVLPDYPFPLLPITPKFLQMLATKSFDIVHAHHPYHISAAAELISKQQKCPLVFTYHTKYEDLSKIYMSFIPDSLHELVSKHTTERTCNNADLVIAPSQYIKKYLQPKCSGKRIEVIPTGISEEKPVVETKSELRKALGIDPAAKVLLTVARLAKEKNLEILIEALTILPEDYTLVIVGTGPHEKDLKTLAQTNKLTHRIIFVGKIPHEEIAKYYLAADVYLFPSIIETQGLNLLEAMYYGLPVVATKSYITNEWLPNNAGITVRNTPRNFKNGVERLFALPLETFSKNARTWAHTYTAEKCNTKLLRLYIDLLKEVDA